jgi:methanogenic corrinoid protein MtbC1
MKLQDNIAKKPKHGGIALCGCLEYEYHEIGITCVNNVLEAHGWTTLFLGTNLPVKYFVDAIEEHVPDLICVSSTTPKSQKQFVESCALLFETAQIINAKMIVGGFAITDKLIKRIQAGHHSHSIADLMTFVNALPIKK